MGFREYKGLHLPSIAEELLTLWEERDVFKKSIEQKGEKGNFVFYEGPPSANGLPGIHHVMGRAIKDTFCRYKTLKGFRVHRKAGWDTHGLPVELQIEKKLGLQSKKDIETYGIAQFNKLAIWVTVDGQNLGCQTGDDVHGDNFWNSVGVLIHVQSNRHVQLRSTVRNATL